MDRSLENLKLQTGRARSRQILVFFLFILFVLAMRIFYLQVIRHEFYLDKANDQRKRIITLSPDRGDIFDRNGDLLATSIDTYSVFAVPSGVKDKQGTSAALSKILKENEGAILQKLDSDKPFVWISRKIEEPLAQKLKDKKLPGIGLLMEKKRVYPRNRLASQVLGFVGMDNEGLSGIEISCDRYLRGEEGTLITEEDPRGREILTSNLRVLRAPTNGGDITLTIDEPIQYKAETEIKKMTESSHSISGSVIVMDIKSGEILAIASFPDFDPNNYQKFKQDVWYNRVVTDVYEPGSTFKLVTVASGLDDGVITPNSVVYCPDEIRIGGRVIRNSHELKFPTKYLSLNDILGESVNTGVVQIAQKIGKDRFYKNLKAFGFGEQTGIELLGESKGILYEPSLWDKPDIAVLSFGQGVAVTPVQLLASLSAIANGGIRMKPRLIKKIENDDANFYKVYSPESRGQAVSTKVAGEVMGLCEYAVENGTGHLAKIDGFRVCGKTGTAQKTQPGGRGYMEGHYISSFIGFVPTQSPRIAVLVVLDDPKPVYWGERVAAPVFKNVAQFSLRRLDIAPDKKESSVI
jgi:cell division protein FtsI/penicillin-binding protein 2